MSDLAERVMAVCEEHGPLQYSELASVLDDVSEEDLSVLLAELAKEGRLIFGAGGFDAS